MASLPNGDNFFSNVSYKGAFSAEASELWLHGWSTLAKNGHLSTIASVENINLDNFNASIYPNPATDFINISFFSNTNTNVFVMDATGRNIFTSLNNASGKNNFNLDTKKLSAGIYFLQINDGKNSNTKKFIIE